MRWMVKTLRFRYPKFLLDLLRLPCRFGIHRMVPMTEERYSEFKKGFVETPGRHKGCLHCCYMVRLKEVISTWESVPPT